MPKHLFIAEKPSLAEEIAKARAEEIGASARKAGGCWQVGDDAVAWLFGHMYELAQPQEYDERFKRWDMDDLPIVPDKWKLVVDKDKRDHIKNINGLIKSASVIVNAGDAAREGQLLVDEVLIEAGWDPFGSNTKRLWVKSMARKDMLEALRSMFPNAEKRNLYHSAVCRQRADWAHGINLTRQYTVLARRSGADMLVSVGRVQSPTEKLVVDRDREIENFKPVDHYIPSVTFEHANGRFQAAWVVPDEHAGLDSEGRLIDKAVAEAIAAKVSGKTGKVAAFTSSDKSKAPPLPFSLSALQTKCSAALGLSAKQTLDIAQRLYETHKVTTYPRSDSRYLPTTILKDEAPKIMKALAGTDALGETARGATMSIKSAAWNDSKVSDHHAIIPTTEFSAAKLAELSDVERKVFLIIAKAFIAQFYPDERYKALSATVVVENETFKASGRIQVDVGWKAVFGAQERDEDDEQEDSQTLPVMAKGDPAKAVAANLGSKRTKPPARFTDGTLIAAMANIHRFVSNPEIKKRLKENEGLGTEATRADVIETLIKRKFLDRKGKNLISSQAGRSVIDALPAEITDPGLTAIWEGYLERVARGELTAEKFMEGQIASLRKRIETGRGERVSIKGVSVEPLPGHGEKCPKCGKGTMITRVMAKGDHKGKKFLACDNWRKDDPTSCRHAAWPSDGDGKPVEPLPGHGGACPKCGKGKMVTRVARTGDHKGKRFLSCDNWKKDDPSSCGHSEWPRDKVDELPGHGKACTACGKGKMITRVVGKGDHKGKRFLSCDQYPACNASEWPDRGSPKASGSASSASSGAKPGLGRLGAFGRRR